MIYRKIKEYVAFGRQSLVLLADQKVLFFSFIGLSCIGALTEGVSISLLVPILETQSGKGSFSSIPILGSFSSHFSGMPASNLISYVAVAMAVVVIVRNIALYIVEVLGSVIPIYLGMKMNMRSYASLMAVEIAYINGKEYGDLFNGLGGWSDRITTLLTSVAALIWNLMVVLVYSAMMLTISWPLTLAAVSFALIMSLILRMLTTVVLQRASAQFTDASAHLSQMTIESLTGMKLVRLTAAEPLMTGKYRSALERLNDVRRLIVKIQAIPGPLMSGAAGVFICALLLGNAVIHSGEPASWVGPILLFLLLLFRLMGPVGNINSARSRIVSHMHAFDMLNVFYRETKEREQPSGTRPALALEKYIKFENVSFSYEAAGRPAVYNVTTTVDRGAMVAVVGPSGAGKTTLISLMARLFDPSEGRITVDGVDMREFDVRTWRKRLAIVSQDIFLFNDTVANNIAFGHEDVTREQIEAAAKLAAAGEFIERLPDGYNTLLGDRGVRLSGGQQQRIAIARAIIASPDLLIFDEATSNLDTFTERAIQEAMERMAKDRTVIVIAHRLSTIRRADKVIVMEDGRLVEEGKHQELLARRGAYWEMVEHQRLDLVEGAAASAAEHAYQ